MKRLEFLALLASPVLLLLPKEDPKKVGVFVGNKHITTLDQITFSTNDGELDLSDYDVSVKVYKLTAENIKVSEELMLEFRCK